jgi:pyruvate ferredoxin oxidoreductase beta subunit
LTSVIAAHHIPYAAQTVASKWKDLYQKSEKAIYTKGPAFMNVLTPCARGWRCDTQKELDIVDLAVETCFWPLYEIIDGKYILNYRPKKKLPITEWLKPQGRFKHLFKSGNEYMIEAIQKEVDKNWEELLKKCD